MGLFSDRLPKNTSGLTRLGGNRYEPLPAIPSAEIAVILLSVVFVLSVVQSLRPASGSSGKDQN